ncbi:MAG: nucleotidyltransferase domain-containing protein, partial [bacterium]
HKKEQLEAVIKQIVRTAQPEKIILFGSAAKNTASEGSDFDLLVLKKGDENNQLTGDIYVDLQGINRPPVDVVVISPETFEKNKNVFGTLPYQAHREGKVVYIKNNE